MPRLAGYLERAHLPFYDTYVWPLTKHGVRDLDAYARHLRKQKRRAQEERGVAEPKPVVG